MFKKFLQTLLGLILIVNMVNYCQAAGRVEVNVGEKFKVTTEKQEGVTSYTWTVKDLKGTILKTVKNRTIEFVFSQPKKYIINLQTVNDKNGEIRNTKILVTAKGQSTSTGDDDPSEADKIDDEVTPTIFTDPPFDADNIIHLNADGGEVKVSILNLPNDFKEFRIDKDFSRDNDLDLNDKNDVDNFDDRSFRMGTPYTIIYQPVDEQYQFSATIVRDDKSFVKKEFKVVFDGVVIEKEETLYAQLSTIPQPKEDRKIHLYQDQAGVIFDATMSLGNISEYRIDANIYVDSDKDGDPANDIDNKEDSSLKTGQEFKYQYDKTSAKIVAQLTVVAASGKMNRVEKEIIFDEITELVADFVVDTDRININNEITFFNLSFSPNKEAELVFRWDFDGDGQVDLETTEKEVSFGFTERGDFDVSLEVEDTTTGDKKSYTKTINVFSVEDIERLIQPTIPDFSFEVDQNKVIFTDLTKISPELENKEISYTWDFGDGTTSTFANPEHVYESVGEYIIVLNVLDSTGDTKTKTNKAVIENIEYTQGDANDPGLVEDGDQPDGVIDDTGDDTTDEVTDDPADDTGDTTEPAVPSTALPTQKDSGSPLWWSIIKYIFYFFLFIVFLILLIVVGGTVFIKSKHPDFTIMEAFHEFRDGLLKRFTGGKPGDDKPHLPPSAIKKQKMEEEADGIEAEPEVIKEEESEVNKEEPEVDESKVPDWMKEAEEGEVRDQPAASSDKSEEKEEEPAEDLFGESEEKPAEATPDWLKSDDEKDKNEEDTSSGDLFEEEEIKPVEPPPAEDLFGESEPTPAPSEEDTPDWLKADPSSPAASSNKSEEKGEEPVDDLFGEDEVKPVEPPPAEDLFGESEPTPAPSETTTPENIPPAEDLFGESEPTPEPTEEATPDWLKTPEKEETPENETKEEVKEKTEEETSKQENTEDSDDLSPSIFEEEVDEDDEDDELTASEEKSYSIKEDEDELDEEEEDVLAADKKEDISIDESEDSDEEEEITEAKEPLTPPEIKPSPNKNFKKSNKPFKKRFKRPPEEGQNQ